MSKPKTCRHCNIMFKRPDSAPIPDDRCTRCDDEIKALWPEPEPVTARTPGTQLNLPYEGHDQ